MKSSGPGPGIIVPFALFTDLLNQSPPDLELKESSERVKQSACIRTSFGWDISEVVLNVSAHLRNI